jgi:uncharacterized protein YllA (UPF0747 family)
MLLPDGKLQERELNLMYFLNKYGRSFWKSLKTRLADPNVTLKEHHLIRVSSLFSPPEKEA